MQKFDLISRPDYSGTANQRGMWLYYTPLKLVVSPVYFDMHFPISE